MPRNERRFARQIARLERAMPRLGSTLKPGSRVRLPLAIALIIGGCLSFLPILGFWMLPLGLVLLAIDLPVFRPLASGGMVRFRQWLRQWGGVCATAGDACWGVRLEPIAEFSGGQAASDARCSGLLS